MSIENDLTIIKDYDKEYCLQVYSPLDVSFVSGKGSYLIDTEGKKYLDMIGGIAVNSLGHGNKAIVKAISSQASKLIHCCNFYYIAARAELALKLCKRSFADKAFFCNSGAEANEAAIKIARGYFSKHDIGRYKILTAKMSFHGRTMGTIAATGQEKFRKPFSPNLDGFDYVEYNNFDDIIAKYDDKTCAIMLELIQGESGVHPASREYIQNVRKFCTEKNILLIIDEVQTGVGRTGRLWAYENYGITPDIMTLAKGLGAGVPIGAMLCTNEVATGFGVGDHGTTFGGNPLCCEVANTVIDQIEENDILLNVNEVSEYLWNELSKLRKAYPSIKDIRGMGLLMAIEFDSIMSASMIRQQLLTDGFLVSAIGQSTIRIAPPLIITKREAKLFVAEIKKLVKRSSENNLSKPSTPKDY